MIDGISFAAGVATGAACMAFGALQWGLHIKRTWQDRSQVFSKVVKGRIYDSSQAERVLHWIDWSFAGEDRATGLPVQVRWFYHLYRSDRGAWFLVRYQEGQRAAYALEPLADADAMRYIQGHADTQTAAGLMDYYFSIEVPYA